MRVKRSLTQINTDIGVIDATETNLEIIFSKIIVKIVNSKACILVQPAESINIGPSGRLGDEFSVRTRHVPGTACHSDHSCSYLHGTVELT